MKNKLWLILLVVIYSGCNDETALGPKIAEKGFIKLFTGSTKDNAQVIKVLSDGFIIIGTAEGDNIKTKLIRLDNNGNTIWKQEYGFDEDNLEGKSLDVISDESGYLIIGDRINSITDSSSMYLFHVNQNGEKIAEADITAIELFDGINDHTGETHGIDVYHTMNNTILTLSEMDEYIDTDQNNIMVDKAILIAERSLSDLTIITECVPKFDEIQNVNLVKSLYQIPSSELIIAGGYQENKVGVVNIPNNCTGQTGPEFLVDANAPAGNFETNQIVPYGVNFAMVGTVDDDIFIRVISSDGIHLRTITFDKETRAISYEDSETDKVKSIDFSGPEVGLSICATSDGGFIIVGSTRIESGTPDEIANEDDILVLKTDGFGNITWFQKFGDTNEEKGVYVQQTSDGGYAILADVEYGGIDMIALIKTDSKGNLD